MPAVLFDLDGTLHDRATGLKAFAQAQGREIGLDGCDHEQFVRRFIELDARGYVHKELVYSTIAEEFRLGPSATVSGLVDSYLSTFAQFAVEMDGATRVLEQLKNRGFKLGIVTNGRTALQTSVIQRLGFDSFTDGIAISEQVGAKKPDGRIFRHALHLVGGVAGSTIMIGDDFEADVRGAHAAGIRSVLFKGQHRSPATGAAMTMEEALDAVVTVLMQPAS